jgi:hypothetical protein
MADRASTMTVVVGSYRQLAEVWSDLERRLTVNLSVSSVVGQLFGGGTAG